MANKIYYFTGTGNSLVIARDISKGLGETELIPISKLIKNNVFKIEGDTIGFIFPVYFSRPPLFIKRFFSKVTIKANYIFSISNGGGMIGRAMKIFKKDLERVGIKLNSGFIVRMPGNYQSMYDVFPEETQKKLFASEKRKIVQIITAIKQKKTNYYETNLGLLGYLFSYVMYNKFYPISNKHDKDFRVNNNCNNCGICEKICPVNNIKNSNAKPEWSGNCSNCFACFHWCPQKAIQHGKKTEKHGRYHNPDIKINELMI